MLPHLCPPQKTKHEQKQSGRGIQTFAERQHKENNDGITQNREELQREQANNGRTQTSRNGWQHKEKKNLKKRRTKRGCNCRIKHCWL